MPKCEAKWSEPKPEAKSACILALFRGIFQNFTHCVNHSEPVASHLSMECTTLPHNTHSTRTTSKNDKKSIIATAQ